MANNVPLVFHVPHASRVIPPDLRRTLLLNDPDLEAELDKLTDAFTDELFSAEELGAQPVVFPVSRMILDPERFLDEEQEVMARHGMGVVYTRTPDGRALRHPPTREEWEALIDRYYHPHHRKFEEGVRSCMKKFGRCTIIDCHSFPSTPLPSDLDQTTPRADICIGTDEFHTPAWLTRTLHDQFENLGWSMKIDAPYAGTIVPMAYYRSEKAIRSVMIEVNRKLYMDELRVIKTSEFALIKQRIAQVLQVIGHADTALDQSELMDCK